MITQRTFDEIRQSIRSNINDINNEVDTKAGTFVSDIFIMPHASELAVYYADLKNMELQQCVNTASDYDLDRLGYNYFVYRKSATKAEGYIRFFITGTSSNTLIKSQLPLSVSVPVGYRVSSSATATSEEVIFITQETAYATRDEIYNLLPRDANTNYKYLEVPIVAESAGSQGNCEVGEITNLYDGNPANIVGCSNVLSTTGGQDKELDSSLRFRISKAVLGANICTKNGYEKFIFEQNNVEDVLVVGAGDPLMFRDGGYINYMNKYVYGRGGMIDIWVRGQVLQEVTTQFVVTNEYLSSEDKNIVLGHQPVISVTSIVSANNSAITFDNAEKYEVEYSVDENQELSNTYYIDVLWDFGITDAFTDTEYYNMTVQDVTEVEMLRQRLNQELLNIKDSMANINYNINWYFQHEEVSEEINPYFTKITVNGKLYKVKANDNRLDGRTFVKKNDKIYERLIGNPDFILEATNYTEEDKMTSSMGSDVGHSILASNSIKWLKDNLLHEGETYNITYCYNQLIYDLQTIMSSQRILTADILIRQAIEVPIQLGMTVYVEDTVDNIVVKNSILSQLSIFINYFKTMGDTLEEAELVSIARKATGVTMIDLDTVYITRNNVQITTLPLQLEANEYFTLTNVSITVQYASDVDTTNTSSYETSIDF